MKYLNLTKGYNPFNSETSQNIEFESFVFHGGEPHIKIKPYGMSRELASVSSRINSFNDLGMLLVAVDALNILDVELVELDIPYFPAARQDRVMVHGEPLTVKVYADIINSLGFNMISIVDPHSDVTPALLNKCHIYNNHNFVHRAIRDIGVKHGFIVSPDAGANKKIKELGKTLDSTFSIVKCDKTRDTSTGNIKGFEVYSDNLNGLPCFIVDDICDGGGTFIGLAKELKKKNAGDLFLIVTHGIFSKFFTPFEGLFKGIYTTNSISNDYYSDDLRYEKGNIEVNIIEL